MLALRGYFQFLQSTKSLKEADRLAKLREAALSGHPRFFLGTDSAPHSTASKESPCGCAGVYTGHAAIELYAEAFEAADALDRLEGFSSHFGPDFYGLPRNTDTITLVKEGHAVPAQHDAGITPLRANERLAWRLV